MDDSGSLSLGYALAALAAVIQTETASPGFSVYFVFLGLSERQAVLTLYGVALLFGMLALVFLVAEVRLFYALLILKAPARVARPAVRRWRCRAALAPGAAPEPGFESYPRRLRRRRPAQAAAERAGTRRARVVSGSTAPLRGVRHRGGAHHRFPYDGDAQGGDLCGMRADRCSLPALRRGLPRYAFRASSIGGRTAGASSG